METAGQKFTKEELKKFDGKDGRPAYIAYNGRVYDVTDSFMWVNGEHEAQHWAGQDLTAEMSQAPHDDSNLERVKLVGVLIA